MYLAIKNCNLNSVYIEIFVKKIYLLNEYTKKYKVKYGNKND